MKLSYCKFNGLTLREETFNMNKFNVIRAMRKLVGGMGLMFLGMSIPTLVFKACEGSIKYIVDGKMYDFNGIMPEILDVSSLIMTQMAEVLIIFTLLFCVLRALKNDNMKQVWKESLCMFVAYVAITVFKYIPVVIPNVMRAMGYI